jgi:phage terminase small subunit
MTKNTVKTDKLLKCETFQSLELRHQKFVLNYLKHFNGARSAKNAGFSPKTARIQAAQLLAKLNIQKALAEVSEIILQEDIATIEEIGQFLTNVLRGSIIDDVIQWNEDGLRFTKHSADMPREVKRLIKSVKVTEKTSQKGDWTECKTDIEIHDPLKAAELLGRYLGMWRDKQEVYFPDNTETFELPKLMLPGAFGSNGDHNNDN